MSVSWPKVRWAECEPQLSQYYESGLLKLNCDKALYDLEWHSVLNFEETIKMTVEWYMEFYKNKNQSMRDFTISQIEAYTKSASSIHLPWASND